MDNSVSLKRRKWYLGFCLDLYIFRLETSEEALLLGITGVVFPLLSVPCAETLFGIPLVYDPFFFF